MNPRRPASPQRVVPSLAQLLLRWRYFILVPIALVYFSTLAVLTNRQNLDVANQPNLYAQKRKYTEARISGSECTFCKGEKGIPNLDLVVPQAGGKTCRSIQLMAASEMEGSDMCAILQKEERACCPRSYSPTKTIFVISLQGTPGAHESNQGRLDLFKEKWRMSCGSSFDSTNIEHCPAVFDKRRGYGVTLAWLLCLWRARQLDEEVAIFLEDDARLFENSTQEFCDIDNRGELLSKLPSDTFVAWLGGHTWSYEDSAVPYRRVINSYGAYGFVVPRNSIDDFYAALKHGLIHGSKDRKQNVHHNSLDPEPNFYRAAREHHKKIYAFNPLVVWHEGGYSNTWGKTRGNITGLETQKQGIKVSSSGMTNTNKRSATSSRDGVDSSSTGGGTTKCSFCEDEGGGGIPNLDLEVPNTGGNTCGSIKKMSDGEMNGSTICATLKKEERVCCPVVYEKFSSLVEPSSSQDYKRSNHHESIKTSDKRGMESYWYNTSMTVDAEYRAIHKRNAVMVTMSCAANGKYPFYMYGGSIARWVCEQRSEKAVTAVMVKIFEQECITPSLHSNFMLDIGSNHGYYGLLALKMGCAALLFDLQPECQQMINNAIVRNNFTARGRLIPRGVSDGEGILMVPSKGCEGRFPAQAHEQKNFNQGDKRVQLNPLTHFIRSDQPILMMKVDTEGNEKFVLDGSMPFFERRLIKNAIVELTPELNFWKYVGVTAEEVASAFSHLSELGYTLVSLSDYSVLSTPEDVFNYIMKSRRQFDMWITSSIVAAHDIEAIKVSSSGMTNTNKRSATTSRDGVDSSSTGGGTTKCSFCEDEGGGGIPNLDLEVPNTGGNTCGSIKKMAAREVNGSTICVTLKKEENVCCPVVYEKFSSLVEPSSSQDYKRSNHHESIKTSESNYDWNTIPSHHHVTDIHNTTVTSPFDSWEQAHCWRKRELGNRSTYDLLITGAGYSSTGFFAKVFTEAGYPVGHEIFKANSVGLSDWLMASRRNQHSPFKFNHIFLLFDGTKWNFKYKSMSGVLSDVANDETLLGLNKFNELAYEFKALEWWLTYTLLGENIAECYVRNEDISGELFLNMCLKSELPNCETKDWTSLAIHAKPFNRHNSRTDDQVTWENLTSMVKTENENMVLQHARQVCLKFYSSEEC